MEAKRQSEAVKQRLRETERTTQERARRALQELEEHKGEDNDLLTTPEERRAAEAEKERKRQAAEEADKQREAARQRQLRIDQQEKEARKLLRSTLQLNARGGFDKQVRERLQEIIDKYPDTPSATQAQRQLEKMRE